MHDATGSFTRCVRDFQAVPQRKYPGAPAGPVAEDEPAACLFTASWTLANAARFTPPSHRHFSPKRTQSPSGLASRPVQAMP